MAGLYNIFGENALLSRNEEHSNCHAVVDGSNLQHRFSVRNIDLSNLPEYELAVKNFFQHLLDANITAHVFFDGPSKSDERKWERGRQRRQERLDRFIHGPGKDYRFEYPKPSAIQDIFRDVVRSLGIRSIQVSSKRDYTLEMVSHAKHLDAVLISHNTKFFLEDIPRGFVYPDVQFLAVENSRKCIMRTFHFKELRTLVGLEKAKNQHALIMWAIVLFNRSLFKLFTEPFFDKTKTRPKYYPRGHAFWMGSLLSQKCRKVPQLKLLQFFLENTQAEAEDFIYEKLYPGDRKEAELLFAQNIAARSVEPHDVFDRIEREIEDGKFCDEDLPVWFLRYLTVECKVIPGMMDTYTDRRHQLMPLLEDYKKMSVNRTSLRIRRIVYGILFSESEDRDDEIKVSELDRVGDSLEETSKTPIFGLMDPENPSEIVAVPGLKRMESLGRSERLELFLLSMGVAKGSFLGVSTNEAKYVLSVLRYWIVANDDLRRTDLLRLLLTTLLVEQEYSGRSHIFRKPVKLAETACSTLGVSFCSDSVSNSLESYGCMHPLALFENATVFARTLHRLLMQPLGEGSDAIETITSEIVFHHVCEISKNMNYEALEDLIVGLMDKKSVENFKETVNIIWDAKAVRTGRFIMRGYLGDDQRSTCAPQFLEG